MSDTSRYGVPVSTPDAPISPSAPPPQTLPPQTFRQAVWRGFWCLLGLALCGSAAAALSWKISKTAKELEGFDAAVAILIGVCVAMLLLAGGFGFLGLGIGGSGTLVEPVKGGLVPYEDPREAGRQMRLRVRARLYRAACMLLGVALVLLGPQLLMDGLNDGPHDPRLRRPEGGGSVGGGLMMTLAGLVLTFFSIIALRPRRGRAASVRVPEPTAPHAAHDFTP